MRKKTENKEILILSPFEQPDVRLALETIQSGAFPILHLGRDKKKAEKSLDELSSKTTQSFGVCIVSNELPDIKIPDQVSKILLPYGTRISVNNYVEILYQVHSLDEAKEAIKENISSLVIKGEEGAGRVSQESSFIIFQGIMKSCIEAGVKVYIQGGPGIHASAAYLALGAQGILFDSQIATFPECGAPKEIKDICSKLNGNEMVQIDRFSVLYRKNSPSLPENPNFHDLRPFLEGFDVSRNYIAMGQDVALSVDLYRQYKKLRNFVFAFYEAAHGHILQAKKLNIIGADSPLAKELGIKYPIIQGPMARVSDIPEFIKKVSDAGALPFLALSVMEGQVLRETVAKTVEILGNQSWGISLLGFNLPGTYQEQAQLIVETKPKVVLISGGHGMLAKQFEDAGIRTFVHVPSVSLLDQYIKEGNTNLIFEGRESGGHIGPFYSIFLWEKQINRLLQEEDLSKFNILFAGGIHDAFSSAFVSIMAAGLAVRGAKIGVQMGTSYLYTKEIVETGAITPLYQKLSVENTQTICLESVPGQVNRILPSPYMDYFVKEKQRILSEGSESLKTRIALENINAGRLRIAAKGIEIQENNLVAQTVEEQYEKGMYMIGDISVCIDKLTTIEQLHKAVAVDNQKILSEIEEIPIPAFLSHPVDIAVIGMECILPEASNIEEYWLNIVTGKDCIKETPDIRWNKSIFYKPGSTDTDFITCKTGGFVPTVHFDPVEFGLTPQSLASIEPLQLLSLLVAKRALENAGYGELTAEESENTAVIFGGEGLTDLATRIGFRGSYRQIVGELPEELKERLPKLTTDTFTGILSNITSGRISNRLNLRGSNYVVSSACATGLTALQLACNELTSHDSDMVVLGGDDFHSMLNDYLLFSSTYALSPTGYCASFDTKADGMTLGEGVGVVILKRLEDAERDGDEIYAVIKGIGCSSDGRGLSLTAPNKEGQVLALQRAYREAGISPNEVGLIEAHGTGTAIGDRTEFHSTSSVYWNGGATPGQTYIGTVKSQIGHTKCAAGISGLIRAVLSVYNGIIPPTIHLEKPINQYNTETSPFVFNTQAGIWNSEKRIAGISAFGFGGTNGHALIENYKPEVSKRNALKTFPAELIVFRGDTLDEAKEKIKKTQVLYSIKKDLTLKDLAYSLATENDKPIQIIIVASSLGDISLEFMSINFDDNSPNVYFRKEKQGKVAFLFPGQGSQRVNMARDLFVAFPNMRRLLIQNKAYEKILFPHTLFSEAERIEWDKTITTTQNAQAILGIVDYAIAEFLRFLEIEPDMVAGHSYGELPALCFAGAFDSEKLVEISRKRADSILNAVENDTGKMIAVSLPIDELNILLEEETEVWAVNFNSPKQTVLAGTTSGMTTFTEKLNKQNIAYKILNVACAFHSPLLHKAKELYADAIKDIPFHHLQIAAWSNTTAGIYPENGNEIKDRMSEHLVQPVLFSKEIEAMFADGARIFIETGPGNVLTSLAKSILGKNITAIHTEEKGKEGILCLLHALAQYLSTGKTFNFEKLFSGRDAKIIDIDHPAQYQESKLIWYVNGQYAEPTDTKLLNIARIPSIDPLNLKVVSENELAEMSKPNFAPDTTQSVDQVMIEYLGSVRSMIENQRDVMLSYFGQNPQENRPRPVEPTSVRAIEASVPRKQSIESEVSNLPAAASDVSVSPRINLTTEEIKTTILEVVSEKTGYPIEMLGMDLDLEGDLSIDSIKRLEIIGYLKNKLNLNEDAFMGTGNTEDAFVKMASLKTLNELISWVDELGAQSVAMNATVEEQAIELTTSSSPKEPNAIQFISTEHIKEILLDIVSNKTGYPIEMLGMDLDLEGDLSIDSIKRMEIIGDLNGKLNLDFKVENTEEIFIKMASLKTLNELIHWIDEMNTSYQKNAFESGNEIVETDKEQETNQKPVELSRILLELKPYPLKPETISIEGKRFALICNEEEYIPTQIKSILENEGAQVDIVHSDADIDSYDGLALINLTTLPNNSTLHDLFNLIHGTRLDHLKWVFTFSDIIGKIESENTLESVKEIQGFSGFLKTLRIEYPEVKFRSVLSKTLFNKETLAQMVLDELSVDDIFPEVIYNGFERYRNEIRMEDLVFDEANVHTHLKLDKDSVVLVLGGAQGITPELISQLAMEYPCRYLLVGRSEQIKDPESIYTQLKTPIEIRKHLITIEGMKIPAEIEKKIQKISKSNHIAETVEKMEKTGAQVSYQSIDITDREKFRTFLQSVRKEYGKIDAIIHSAGLLNDKFFADKTWESFEKVYQTKVNPLHVIIEEIKDDLKLLVLFSSVASSYGSKGQSDYTAANSVFDLTASLSGMKSDLRIVTFNWGPWKGAGMVSDSLEAEFTRRGISLIPLKEGSTYFVQELKYGEASEIIVMGGKEEVENFLKSIN